MKIIIAGASGMVGSALTPALQAAGHTVLRLVRGRSVGGSDEIAWNPAAGELDLARVAGAGAIINLAGENLGARRWTAARRERMLRSRVDATRTLVAAMAELKQPPETFVSASGVGYYGDRGDEELIEESGIGQGYLPELCLAWETHAEGASRLGVRTAVLRFGVILDRRGGMLARMLPLFRLGLGGRLGSGKQWLSWVEINDVVGVIAQVLRDPRCAGVMNVVAPGVVTNAEFTRALASVLGRPAFLPVPAWALRLVVGGMMTDEALLASARAVPQRLNDVGYAFRHATVASALRAQIS